MNINRHNYEEYFILYADNELSSDDRRMVDDFVLENPDLKEELDSYLNTILSTGAGVIFENKEELHRYEDSILSYIDEELPADEKEKFEQLISGSPKLQQELSFFQKTKLQPDTEIIFENKNSLYRSTEKRISPIRIMRWAAAAAILLAISITAINYYNKKSVALDEVATANSSEKKTPAINPAENIVVKNDDLENKTSIVSDNPIAQPTIEKPVKPNTIALTTEKQIKQQPLIVPNDKKKEDVAANQQPPTNNLPSPQNNPLFKGNDQKKNDAIATIGIEEKQKNVNGDNVDKNAVTNAAVAPLYITNSTTIDTELNTGEENKNKKSRGFFRKITRLFEKNTGIKATDDDKLRIAAFTVKL